MHYTQMIQKPITVQTKSKPIHYPVLIFQKKKPIILFLSFILPWKFVYGTRKGSKFARLGISLDNVDLSLPFLFLTASHSKNPNMISSFTILNSQINPEIFFFFSLFLTFLTQKANTSLQFFPLNFQILCPPPFSLSASFI